MIFIKLHIEGYSQLKFLIKNGFGIAKVKIGQSVSLLLTNQSDKLVSGTVYGINKSFEVQNKSVIVHARVNNVASLNLIPGMYINALIETRTQMVQAVPKDAVIKANDKQYIFIFEGTEKEPIKQDKNLDEDNKNHINKKFR